MLAVILLVRTEQLNETLLPLRLAGRGPLRHALRACACPDDGDGGGAHVAPLPAGLARAGAWNPESRGIHSTHVRAAF